VHSSRIKQLFVNHFLLRLKLCHRVLNCEEVHPEKRVIVHLLGSGLLLLLLEHILVLDVLKQKLLLIHLLIILFLF